jgi:hypothetical protein
MGLFSTKKTIVVSSSVYNMAGLEEDRPDFLKSSIFSAIMSPYDKYLGEVVVGNLLSGPGIKQRSFFNWAIRNNFAGLPTFSVRASFPVDPDVVGPEIPVPASPAGLETRVQSTFAADGEYGYYVEQWLMVNNPAAVNTEYGAEYDAFAHTILITYEGGSTQIIPGGTYDSDKQDIIAYYYQAVPENVEPLVTGTSYPGVSDPDTTGFNQTSVTNTGAVSYTSDYDDVVDKTYSDGRPSTQTRTAQSDTVSFNGTETIYSRVVYNGSATGEIDSPETSSLETFLHVFETRDNVDKIVVVSTQQNDVGGGVTETVTTSTDGEHLEPYYTKREDDQTTYYEKVDSNGAQMWIYQFGSGVAVLDALQSDQPTTATSEFFPYIPIRLNNVSITDDVYANVDNSATYVADGVRQNTAPFGNGLFKECTAAYRKANGNGQRFSELVDQVEDNDDLSEIDYAYVVFGVSLAVTEPKCRNYLYQFFKDMIPYQNTTGTYMTDFIAHANGYESARSSIIAWQTAQEDWQDPLYGTARPTLPNMVDPETTTVKIKSEDPRTKDFDFRITWISIDEESFTGVAQENGVDAQKGDVWLQKGDIFTYNKGVGLGSASGFASRINTSYLEVNDIERTEIYKQTGVNTYTRLTIYGLLHRNFVYGGKSVKITAHDALDDTEPTGFIVPLHSPTTRALSLVDSTQMATANTFIVFNSYQIFKKKWYETFLGMLFIIITIVVIAAVIAPAAVGSVTGALGSNAAVGAGFGLTGTSAVVAGAVANALAAIVISSAITTVSTQVFGEKWGAIIGQIASFAVSFGMGGGFSNMSLSTLMTPSNLLGFASSLANGYAGFVQAEIAEMGVLAQENAAEYKTEMEKLEDMIRDLGGSNDLSFDPMQLTDSSAGNGAQGSYIPESLDEFIHRTTMTGSDIVDVTLSLVTDYADLNRQLPGT